MVKYLYLTKYTGRIIREGARAAFKLEEEAVGEGHGRILNADDDENTAHRLNLNCVYHVTRE